MGLFECASCENKQRWLGSCASPLVVRGGGHAAATTSPPEELCESHSRLRKLVLARLAYVSKWRDARMGHRIKHRGSDK